MRRIGALGAFLAFTLVVSFRPASACVDPPASTQLTAVTVNTGPPLELTLVFDSGWTTFSTGSTECLVGFRLPTDLIDSVNSARLVFAETNTTIPGFGTWSPNATTSDEIADLYPPQPSNEWFGFSSSVSGVSGGDTADFQVDVSCKDDTTVEEILTRVGVAGTARLFSDEGDGSGVPAGTHGGFVNVTIPGAPRVDPRLRANVYRPKLVQAFDPCDPEGGSVTTLPNGLLACGDGELDGTAFNRGKLIVKHRVFPTNRPSIIMALKSSGTQVRRDTGTRPLAGKELAVRLVLRISETDPDLPVTFTDQEVTCPSVIVPGNGNIVQKVNLASCLRSDLTPLPTTALTNTTNKEIVSASVLDATSGLAIAVPGLRHVR